MMHIKSDLLSGEGQGGGVEGVGWGGETHGFRLCACVSKWDCVETRTRKG